jgi:trans-aconitate methyltransferase
MTIGRPDWNAPLYDQRFSCIAGYGRDLIPLLDPQPGRRILDLGCGTGTLTAEIAASGAEVIGVDASEGMIDEARQRFPEITFLQMDARRLTIPGPFDDVFSNAVLHWIPEAEDVMRGVAAVMRLGGRFVLEMGGRGNIRSIRAALYASLHEVGRGDLLEGDPWYFPGIGEYSSLLDSCGFRTVYAVLFPRPTPLDARPDALAAWLDVFARDFLAPLSDDERKRVVERIEDYARPALFRDGRWVVDYVRLRVVAERIGGDAESHGR